MQRLLNALAQLITFLIVSSWDTYDPQYITVDGSVDMKELANSRRNRPDLYDNSKAMKAVVRRLYFQYWSFRKGKGVRRINKADWPVYFIHLSNIVTDVYSAWLEDPTKYVGYGRGKQNFVRGGSYWDFTKDKALLRERIFLNLIDFLAEQGYIQNHNAESGFNLYSSRMRAEPKLIERLQASNVSVFRMNGTAEAVI